MAKQFLTIDDQPNNAALEIIDSDGRAIIIPLLLGSQIASLVLGNGTYANQPLVWDGVSAWIPAAGVVASQQFSGEDNTVAINLPTPTPGFPTRCSWIVESANMLDIERDSTALTRRWEFIGDTLSPLQMIAPDVGDPLIGFLGATPVVRPTVTGSRGGNAALASVLTALADLGLIVDSSTA